MARQAEAEADEAPALTRHELATKRASARMWATDEFRRLARDLVEREPSPEARLVYKRELIAYLTHVSESLVTD